MKKNRFFISILGACFYCLSHFGASAQNSATEGTEFYLTFTDNYHLDYSNSVLYCQVRYVVTEACNITLRYGDGTTATTSYAPGVYTVNVNKSKAYNYLADQNHAASNKFIKITATKNIGVYAINASGSGSDATTVLPVTALGKKYTNTYRNGGYISQPGGGTDGMYANYIAVIAPTPNTTVSLYKQDGSLFQTVVISNTNQAYFFVEKHEQGGDNYQFWYGYTVVANNDVAVFCNTSFGTMNNERVVFEQIFPENTAGHNYFAWNLSNTSNSYLMDLIYITAIEDGTAVNIKQDATNTPVTLQAHQYHQERIYFSNSNPALNQPLWITSNKPIVVQHTHYNGGVVKMLSPVEQRITHAIVATFYNETTFLESHYLNIMIPAGSENSMVINEKRGQTITPATVSFSSNPTNPDYMTARIAYHINPNDPSNDPNYNLIIELFNPAGFIAYMTGNYREDNHSRGLLHLFCRRRRVRPYGRLFSDSLQHNAIDTDVLHGNNGRTPYL